ncbi:hypothetical protein LINGRAHAP2_LOCUS19908, partial [Linum grandiflorum]
PSGEGCFTFSTNGSLRSPTKSTAAGGVIRTDTARFVKAFASNPGSCSITRAEMRAIIDGCKLLGLWVFDGYKFTPTRWLPLLFLPRTLTLTINMRRLFSNSKRSIAANGKLIYLMFTAKQTMQRTIWSILVILSLMGYISLSLHIETCLIGFITILLTFLCLVL